MYCQLKDLLRIATRYDRDAVNFLAAVCIAASHTDYTSGSWRFMSELLLVEVKCSIDIGILFCFRHRIPALVSVWSFIMRRIKNSLNHGLNLFMNKYVICMPAGLARFRSHN